MVSDLTDPIEVLNLTKQSCDLLRRAGCTTVGQVAMLSYRDLRQICGLEWKHSAGVLDALDAYFSARPSLKRRAATARTPRVSARDTVQRSSRKGRPQTKELTKTDPAIGLPLDAHDMGKKHRPTRKTILDGTPYKVLGLSPTARRALSRTGINTIGQLKAIWYQRIWNAWDFDEEVLSEITEKLTAYLGVEPSPAVVAPQNRARPTSEKKPSVLLARSSPGTPLKALWLSTRACRALRRYDIATVEELAQTPDHEILAAGIMGRKTLAEIRKKLRVHLSRNPSPISPARPCPPLAHGTPIDVLGLSLRPHNALRRRHITTVEQLVKMAHDEVLAIRNIGTKSLAEIKEKLRAYLAANPPPVHASCPTGDATRQGQPVPVADPDLLDAARERSIRIDNIPIEKLSLSEATKKVLYHAGIETLEQLARQPRNEWKAVRGLIRTVNEYLGALVDEEGIVVDIGSAPLPDTSSHQGLDIRVAPSLQEVVLEALGQLDERTREAFCRHYGLARAPQTLQAIGASLGVTRERVRQLVARAMSSIRRCRRGTGLQPFARALVRYVKRKGGLVAERELREDLWLELDLGDMDPKTACMLLGHYASEVTWMRGQRALGDTSQPLQQITVIRRELRRLVAERSQGVRETVSAFCQSRFCRQQCGAVAESFVKACLRTDPQISVVDGGLHVTRAKRATRAQMITAALREIGEPAHYAVIAERVNQHLSQGQQINTRSIYACLTQKGGPFVRVGRGTFGLAG